MNEGATHEIFSNNKRLFYCVEIQRYSHDQQCSSLIDVLMCEINISFSQPGRTLSYEEADQNP